MNPHPSSAKIDWDSAHPQYDSGGCPQDLHKLDVGAIRIYQAVLTGAPVKEKNG
jgi:hypothetical protein